MKKTFGIQIILCLSVMFCVFFLTSCEHKHDFKDWKITKQATCTADGEQIGTCKCGETETQKIAATGHTPGVAATCITPQNCTVCKKELLGAQGHSYNHMDVTAPTCTKKGYTTYTCSCGKTKTDKYVDALGHTPDNESACLEATKCTLCNEELSPALGHRVWAEVELPEVLENYTVGNDAAYPFAMQNGVLISSNHGSSTSSTYTLTALRDFTLGFEYKVSSENWDYLEIYQNSNQLVRIAGSSDWQKLTVGLQAGDTVTFTYSKDGSVSSGDDCAYVKLLVGATVTKELQLVEATEAVLAGITPSTERNICCEECGEVLIKRLLVPSVGLSYQLNGDGTYTVVGIGTCTDTDIVIPSTHNGGRVTGIGEYAFAGGYGLTSVALPESVTVIGSFAFSECVWLANIDFSEGLTTIGEGAFYGCALEDIVLPEGVTVIGEVVFGECENLENIVLPDSLEVIGDRAFYGCVALESIKIPCGVTSIGSAIFESCDSLTEISADESNAYYSSANGVLFNKNKTALLCYPKGKTVTIYTVPGGVTSIGNYAFHGCVLEDIEISDSVTSIGDYAFSGCLSLKKVKLSGGLTSIGYSAFFACTALASIEIPDGVTVIGEYAFAYSSALKSITLPDSVTNIGAVAFTFCISLETIRFDGTVSQWQTITFGDDWDYSTGNYKVICTNGTVAKS